MVTGMPTTHLEGMYSKEIHVGAGQGLYEKPLYLPSIFFLWLLGYNMKSAFKRTFYTGCL